MRGRGGRLQGEMVVHGEQHKKTHRRRQLSPHRVTARKDTALPQSVPVQGRAGYRHSNLLLTLPSLPENLGWYFKIDLLRCNYLT